MTCLIKEHFRKKMLERSRSDVPTGLLPLEQIQTAVAIVNMEEPAANLCKEELLSFFKKHDIQGEIFYLDFRKEAKDELQITSPQTTFRKKDLNWAGRPCPEKANYMRSHHPDLFISLVGKNNFPLQFLATCSQARFKIGRMQLPDQTFDLIVTHSPQQEILPAQAFVKMTEILKKIK